ncbi:MAG: peptide-methionine (S)-S-oxide reductase MsrA [Nitrospira sp.]|nr:peptide-methionine (S)-S-oxide reductase MsrA [bacterium]MBL7049425.1 peptide-methionine (S)-S-oxide reductase MsrA [Nitrospira sp.]
MEQHENSIASKIETATIAGGCFWCLEAVFLQLRGVEKVISGYAGGTSANPTYHAVSTGTTGHAEVVQISFNTAEISYRDILKVFFTIHDPTTKNRQGADTGTQYRSAIFYHDQEQKKIAEDVMQRLGESDIWGGVIVTEVSPLQTFYPAEDFHQDYYQLHADEPYCRVVIEPKVAKLRKLFIDKLKKG